MLTTSWVIKVVIIATVLSGISAIGFAEMPAPTQVDLARGRRVQQKENRLYEVDASKHKVSVIQLPPAFKRAVATSSSIAFPDDHSRLIEGKEYFLVVVNQSSSSNPTGYCGAGEEGTLYALELRDGAAVPRFSTLVQSCLKDFDLASDSGVKSGYLAIKWKNSPVGIQVHWDIYGNASDVNSFYRYEGGAFVADKQ
ncbi:hypothetical protein [Paraburkholderia domus]|uniref:Uncharacterized protein n=1 Tax=Paraburkholderia domus TaxID=2793075 RepID=A0A9N8R4X7_9BURK|nr:hypothetical protein [Paraburkholderia domus]MBK5168934.1 hypothetical protein [Burkholderia sp. R-70211]CAE6934651.1 hypothetical protein R70211_05317 [Paraburkholderia domus]